MEKERILEKHDFKIGDQVIITTDGEFTLGIVEEIQEDILNGIAVGGFADYRLACEPKSLVHANSTDAIKAYQKEIDKYQSKIDDLQRKIKEIQ